MEESEDNVSEIDFTIDGANQPIEDKDKGKGKKGRAPIYQLFFHTINKRNDDTRTDGEFFSWVELKLRRYWALRETKKQTWRGLLHLSWRAERGSEKERPHFHVILKFHHRFRKTYTAMFKALFRDWQHVDGKNLVVKDWPSAWRYINKAGEGSKPIEVLGEPIASQPSNLNRKTEKLQDRLWHYVVELGIRDERRLIQYDHSLIGKQKEICHILKLTKEENARYIDRLYDWEAYFMFYFRSVSANQRNYLHFYDHSGKSGKSYFAAAFRTYYGKDACIVNAAGHYKDIVETYRHQLSICKYVIVDCSRSENNAKSVAKLVEFMLNNSIPTVKWAGDDMATDISFVAVFSNEPPYPSRLSLDRTICVQIPGQGDDPFHVMPTREWLEAHNTVNVSDATHEDYFHFEDHYVNVDPTQTALMTNALRDITNTARGSRSIDSFYERAPQRRLLATKNKHADEIEEDGWSEKVPPWVKRESCRRYIEWEEGHPTLAEEIRTMFVDPCKDCEWNQFDIEAHNGLDYTERLIAKAARDQIDTKKLRKDFMANRRREEMEQEAKSALEQLRMERLPKAVSKVQAFWRRVRWKLRLRHKHARLA